MEAIEVPPNGVLIVPSSLRISNFNDEDDNRRDNPGVYWRFTEAAELIKVWCLEIKTPRNLNQLPLADGTRYAAYLIFKIGPTTEPDGLNAIQQAYVTINDEDMSRTNVCVKRTTAIANRCVAPIQRQNDDWMELELGQFDYNDVVKNDHIVVGFMENNMDNTKRGLIVAGIELRPV